MIQNHKQTCLRLPETWRSNSFEDYDAMINNLDYGSTGFVQLESLFLLFILAHLQIPSQKEVDAWEERLSKCGSHLIGKSEFMSTPSWFDDLERQP